jgi:hypothetical protein
LDVFSIQCYIFKKTYHKIYLSSSLFKQLFICPSQLLATSGLKGSKDCTAFSLHFCLTWASSFHRKSWISAISPPNKYNVLLRILELPYLLIVTGFWRQSLFLLIYLFILNGSNIQSKYSLTKSLCRCFYCLFLSYLAAITAKDNQNENSMNSHRKNRLFTTFKLWLIIFL